MHLNCDINYQFHSAADYVILQGSYLNLIPFIVSVSWGLSFPVKEKLDSFNRRGFVIKSRANYEEIV